jgi:ADP-ribose pyrophosphatase
MREPAGSRRVFDGQVVSVDLEDWGLGFDYEVVRALGAAAVLPLTPADDVLLVRQFRPPVRDALVEIPAGLLDIEGEDPLTCAGRELREETGFDHRAIEFLGGYYSSAGLTDEYVHLFWARTEPMPTSEPEEGIEVLRRPFGQMVDAARAGRVRDAKTALAILMAAARPSLP